MPSLLKLIADNPALTDALRALLERHFALEKLDHQASDELLGQAVRARLVGMKQINEAFKELATHKTTKPQPEKRNEAR